MTYEVDLRKIVYELYVLLDDIDTADDIAKGNEAMYRNLVRSHTKKRFDIVDEMLTVESLYDLYYPKESNEEFEKGMQDAKTAIENLEQKAADTLVDVVGEGGWNNWDQTNETPNLIGETKDG